MHTFSLNDQKIEQKLKEEDQVDVSNEDQVDVSNSEMTKNFKGIRAKRDFLPGEIIFEVKGRRVDFRSDRTLQIDANIHIDPVDPSGEPKYGYYLNHSCNPNAYPLVDEQPPFKLSALNIYALREIKAGDEITVDYAFMESEIANECECLCGSTNCRGRIIGFKKLRQQEVENYLNKKIPLSTHLIKLLD